MKYVVQLITKKWGKLKSGDSFIQGIVFTAILQDLLSADEFSI